MLTERAAGTSDEGTHVSDAVDDEVDGVFEPVALAFRGGDYITDFFRVEDGARATLSRICIRLVWAQRCRRTRSGRRRCRDPPSTSAPGRGQHLCPPWLRTAQWRHTEHRAVGWR
jgi:hypothetical protein